MCTEQFSLSYSTQLISELAKAAVRSKAVVLLLLIYCLMYFPLFEGVLYLSLFCYAIYCVHSRFANNLEEEEKAGCFAIIVLQMY